MSSENHLDEPLVKQQESPQINTSSEQPESRTMTETTMAANDHETGIADD
jgi:hypothetical protein